MIFSGDLERYAMLVGYADDNGSEDDHAERPNVNQVLLLQKKSKKRAAVVGRVKFLVRLNRIRH